MSSVSRQETSYNYGQVWIPLSANWVKISVSDPGHFYTDPDPTKNENTEPDPSNYIADFFFRFWVTFESCNSGLNFEGFF